MPRDYYEFITLTNRLGAILLAIAIIEAYIILMLLIWK